MAKYNLIGHENNVCALSYADNNLISGSWDATAPRSWDLESMQTKYVLRGHTASVWDVKILDTRSNILDSYSAHSRKWKG